jgi:hypothetical protein
MIGPTKVEAVADLIEVVNFDPTTALAPVTVMCPDCRGAGLVAVNGSDPEYASVDTVYCGTCGNSGVYTLVGWSLEKMTPAFKRLIQDIKHDARGRLMLTFRNKDKAAAELKAMLGWDKPDSLGRNAAGQALTVEELAAKQADIAAGAEAISRDRVIMDLMTLADDPLTSASERANILKTVAQLKGFLTESGEKLPDAPPLSAFYAGAYPTPPTLEPTEPTPLSVAASDDPADGPTA